MQFMIDFENTGSAGLRGASFLLPEDTVTIFYSESSDKAESGFMSDIFASGCVCRGYKLFRSGKNSLDFYIASELGRIFGNGYAGKAAIVSKDQGFKGVADFWRYCSDEKHAVILDSTIEKCIHEAQERNERTYHVRQRLKRVSIEAELSAYKERNRMKSLIHNALAETEFAETAEEVQNIISEQPERKIIYLNTLKRFGKRDGLKIYRSVRKVLDLKD